MNRRSFFGNLIGGTTAIAFAPLNALGKIVEEASVTQYADFLGYNLLIGLDGWLLGVAHAQIVSFERQHLKYVSPDFIHSSTGEMLNIYPDVTATIPFEGLKEASDFPGILDVARSRKTLKAWVQDPRTNEIISFDEVIFTDLSLTARAEEPVDISGTLRGTGEILIGGEPRLKKHKLLNRHDH